MNKEELVDKLLNYFINEKKTIYNIDIPRNYKEKRLLLRGIINLRPPIPLSDDILILEDKLLNLELKDKIITDSKDIDIIENKMGIFLGDITTIKCDAIVNAANSAMLGCFTPNHSCIDNQIHTYAGIRLRLECEKILNGKIEKTGSAILTKAYNLPSNYIIHTVGPIVGRKVTKKNKEDLETCYISCLELARKNNIKIVAFPSISTGVFRFPKDEASKIAVNIVRRYLEKYNDYFDKIIFNVFTREDKNYYDRLFKN